MAWRNANRVMKVHLHCSLRFIVEKQKILLVCYTEGCHHCIGIIVADNTIDE